MALLKLVPWADPNSFWVCPLVPYAAFTSLRSLQDALPGALHAVFAVTCVYQLRATGAPSDVSLRGPGMGIS